MMRCPKLHEVPVNRKVGVVLSGCGYLDGSEIHESVLAMLCLDELGVEVVCMAPRGPQRDVVDHERRQPEIGAARDILREAARIARGRIRDLAGVRGADLDAVVLPGGFGAAKNLSDFAVAGAKAAPHPEVARLLRELHAAKKPIGAICIAPAVVAAVLGRSAQPVLTIGRDPGTAQALVAMGARHRDSDVTDCVIDRDQRIVSTPAYMYEARLGELHQGIRKLCTAVVEMMPAPAVAGGRS
jgi:enhancing lycopene biosynthesis protein 2